MAVGVSVRLQWDPDLGVGPAARDADAFARELAFRDANYLCTALLRQGLFCAADDACLPQFAEMSQ